MHQHHDDDEEVGGLFQVEDPGIKAEAFEGLVGPEKERHVINH